MALGALFVRGALSLWCDLRLLGTWCAGAVRTSAIYIGQATIAEEFRLDEVMAKKVSLTAVFSSIKSNYCACQRASYFTTEFGLTLRPAGRHTNLVSGRTNWGLFEFPALHGGQRRPSAARYSQEQAVPLSRSRHKAHDASFDMHTRGCRGAEAVAQVLIRYRKQLLAGVPSATRERAADANA